jgi:hypothetical protein
MELVLTIAVIAAVGALFVASRNATMLCVLSVDGGRVVVKRGAMSEIILSDIADVVRAPSVRRATVRISRRQGRAQVDVSGEVSDAQRQQLRNVIGSVPLAKLVNVRRQKR